MTTHTVNVKTAVQVTEDFLDDVLVCAFDNPHGACWSWAECAGWIRSIHTTPEEEKWEGVHITWEERQDSGLHPVLVDKATLVLGIQRILEAEDINADVQKLLMKAVMDDDAGDVDAPMADIIVQYGLFGEGVYS